MRELISRLGRHQSGRSAVEYLLALIFLALAALAAIQTLSGSADRDPGQAAPQADSVALKVERAAPQAGSVALGADSPR